MGAQGWEEALDVLVADGVAITAAAETIVCPDFNIPAFYMAPGRSLHIWCAGRIDTVVTTPGSGTWRVRWGGVAGTVLLSTGLVNHDVTPAVTGGGWNFSAYIVCRTAGASGTFMSHGNFNCFDIDEAVAVNLKPIPMGSAGSTLNAAVTVNTTIANLLSVTFTQTVGTGSLTCQQRIIEVLN